MTWRDKNVAFSETGEGGGLFRNASKRFNNSGVGRAQSNSGSPRIERMNGGG